MPKMRSESGDLRSSEKLRLLKILFERGEAGWVSICFGGFSVFGEALLFSDLYNRQIPNWATPLHRLAQIHLSG